MNKVKDYTLAMRPWSFTAAIVPIMVTAAVTGSDLSSINFVRALTMGITVQAGANLTNTYYDYKNKVDTKEMAEKGCGEKTLVDKIVTPGEVYILSIFFYILAVMCMLPSLSLSNISNDTVSYIFGSGLALAFFYTATPLGLKYIAFGDITIFLCFGPLLMQCTSLMLTGRINDSLWLYSIPVGALTEAILHANNARDIAADSSAGITTLATVLGFNASKVVFDVLLTSAYTSVLYIALYEYWGCIAALLTIPSAFDLKNKFNDKTSMLLLPEEVAKMHLPFGLLMFLGIQFTSQGFINFI